VISSRRRPPPAISTALAGAVEIDLQDHFVVACLPAPGKEP
jgi:hypothetical protein